jgi:hypothetical protein
VVTYTFSLNKGDYEVNRMRKVMYVEHGNMDLLAKEVNLYLAKGHWELLGPVAHLNGRWVQTLVSGE